MNGDEKIVTCYPMPGVNQNYRKKVRLPSHPAEIGGRVYQ